MPWKNFSFVNLNKEGYQDNGIYVLTWDNESL